MEPQLRNFLQQLLHQAIHSAIHAAFWKMPFMWILVMLAALIGIAVYFQLY